MKRKPTAPNGIYNVGVMYDGVDYRRSSGTRNLQAAIRLQCAIETRLERLKTGMDKVPEGVSIRDYLLHDKRHPDTEPAQSIAITELVDEYEATLGPPKISESTLKTHLTYLSHFRRFLKSQNGKIPVNVEDWMQIHVESYRKWRLSKAGKVDGYSIPRPCSVVREIREIGLVFDYARKKRWIGENPARDLDSIPDSPPDQTFRATDEVMQLVNSGTLTDEELKNVLRYRIYTLDETEEIIAFLGQNADTVFVQRKGDVAMAVELCARTGMRIGEVLKLQRQNINLDEKKNEGDIIVRSKKQSRSVVETSRYAPLPPETVKRLVEWLKGCRTNLVFGKKATEKAFIDRFYRVLHKATKDTKFIGLRPHQLRHSARTNFYEMGVDEKIIDSLLGHTTKAMGDRYRHIRNKRIREQMQKVWNRSPKDTTSEAPSDAPTA